MRVLVTGGCGFQGSHLVEALVGNGHDVTTLNTWSDTADENSRAGARPIWGSVSDPEIVEKSMRGQDVVIHLAARINVDESISGPREFTRVNLMGTQNILEAARNGGQRVIYGSTCEVYGGAGGSLSESSPFYPHSPYAASKAAADRLCHAYRTTYGMQISIVRPFNAFGPRQKEGRGGALIPMMTKKAMDGLKLTLFGSGRQGRDFVHVSDVVAGYLIVLGNPEITEINLGTGISTPVRSIVEHIAKRFGSPLEETPGRPGEVAGFVANCEYARSFGWAPKIDIWGGLDAYMTWRAT